MNTMKKAFTLLTAMMFSIMLSAQTQQGFVKTKGRMVNGLLVPGQGLKGATVSVQGRSTVLVNQENGAFSFPVTTPQFRLDSVKKQGYQLVDMEACPRSYKYSSNPLYIVMETPDQQLQDQLNAERKIRRTLTRQLQEREDEIEDLKALQKITEEEYRAALQKLYDDTDLNEKLVKDMVDRYAKIDYDQLNEFDLQISDYILNGELTKADSLLRTKGDINQRVSQLHHLEQANAEEEEELAKRQEQLAQSKTLASKERNDLANDCYRKFEIFKMQHQNDSAAYYIELRASLDTTKLDWQREAGQFVEEYLADYPKAISYYERMLRQAQEKYGENDTVAKAYNFLGVTHYEQGNYEEAIDYFEKTLEITEKDPTLKHYTATVYANIGTIFATLGNYTKNLEYQLKSYEIREQLFDQDDIDIGNSKCSIATAYFNLGEYDKALENYQAALDIWKKHYDEDDERFAPLYGELGNIYTKLGEFDKALENHYKALSIRTKMFGNSHPDVAVCYSNIGSTLSNIGKNDEALEYLRKALTIWNKVYGELDFKIATAYSNMGNAYLNNNDIVHADSCFQRSLDIRRTLLGENHPDLAYSYNGIGFIYFYQGNPDKALEYFGKALTITEKAQGANHPNVAGAYHNMGYVYYSKGDYDKALEYLYRALEIRNGIFDQEHPAIAANYNIIAHCLFAKEKYEEAYEYYSKALKIRNATIGPDHPDTKNTKECIEKVKEKLNGTKIME